MTEISGIPLVACSYAVHKYAESEAKQTEMEILGQGSAT